MRPEVLSGFQRIRQALGTDMRRYPTDFRLPWKPWFIQVEFRRFLGKMGSIVDELVSCGPLLDDEQAVRSIVVDNMPEEAREEDIIIHFQKRKHGGGDIDRVQMMENTKTVVVMFESYKGWWFSCIESRQSHTNKAL